MKLRDRITSLQRAACSLWLASRLGGKPAHHKHRAERMATVLVRWFGKGGVEDFVLGKRSAYVEVHRVDWKLAKNRTPNEKAAEVLGFASGKTGPYKDHGRYRPHILLIRGEKRAKRKVDTVS